MSTRANQQLGQIPLCSGAHVSWCPFSPSEFGRVGDEGVGVGVLGSGGVRVVGGVGVGKVVVVVSNSPCIKSSSRQIVMYSWAFGANGDFGQMGRVWDKWARPHTLPHSPHSIYPLSLSPFTILPLTPAHLPPPFSAFPTHFPTPSILLPTSTSPTAHISLTSPYTLLPPTSSLISFHTFPHPLNPPLHLSPLLFSPTPHLNTLPHTSSHLPHTTLHTSTHTFSYLPPHLNTHPHTFPSPPTPQHISPHLSPPFAY